MSAVIVNTVEQCGYFNRGQCQSCRHIQVPMAQQLMAKSLEL
ncbi:MAG: 23S rRNA (uracil(747)-C(5))-methyltransferase, partial [Shewanella putrefaciens]|nr:23S rRNA (uracil(747)-C(5))-methyltransferase [Shewanella putrefaciens]